MTRISAELRCRGLTESEVHVWLLQKVIDLENIPSAELPNYQQRFTTVPDELLAEKKQANITNRIQPSQNQSKGSAVNTSIANITSGHSL